MPDAQVIYLHRLNCKTVGAIRGWNIGKEKEKFHAVAVSAFSEKENPKLQFEENAHTPAVLLL